MNSKGSLRQEFESIRPAITRFAENIRHAVQIFLVENKIDVLDVAYRIKEFASFSEKIERKKYTKPFEQV